MLDWEVAELALRESWYRAPVPVDPGPGDRGDVGDRGDRGDLGHVVRDDSWSRRVFGVGDATGSPGLFEPAPPVDDPDATVIRPPGSAEPQDPQTPNSPSTGPDAQFTVYLVRENLVALALRGRQKKPRKLATPTTAISNLYVVFVANYRWWDGARPPVVQPRVAGRLR